MLKPGPFHAIIIVSSFSRRCRHLNIYDISRKAGVSIATVSRVLNDSPHVAEATRERVLREIEKAGYIPNAFARGLGLNTMQTIGLLCPDAADPYQSAALSFLERAFRGMGYNSILMCTGRERDDRLAGVEALRARHVDGIVLMGSGFLEAEAGGNAYLEETAAAVPLVLLGAVWDAPNIYGIHCDDTAGISSAVRFLAASGARRILYLYDSANASGRRKLQGFHEGCAEAGIAPGAAEAVLLPRLDDRVFGEVPAMIADIHARFPFDAVTACNDTLALCALKFAYNARLRVPDDLSIIGYNDSKLCPGSVPDLSSVNSRLPDICRLVADTLVGVLQGEEHPARVILAPELILRGTTKPLPPSGNVPD